ncbi:MAG TPA: hypothetical protein VGR00_04465, partial [Thermoanaerobaculia bacterium]|nr:hypothetical protein [Thermoanaerobaculia bacterium]
TSKYKGTLYVSWTDFTEGNGSYINFARSTDGGATFSAPLAISPKDNTQEVQGSRPAVTSNGDVFVVYADFHEPLGISIAKSTDGGATFGMPTKAATLSPVGEMTGGNGVRTNSFPCVAVDKNDAIHVVYDALPPDKTTDRSDVYYVRSTNGGTTFSAPVRLNDDDGLTTQLFPSIAAAADGTLGVRWWDRRNDPANDGLTDVYMTISTNGGASWGKNFRVTDTNWVFGNTDYFVNFGSGLADYHGDYDDLVADGGQFHLGWSDERGADPDVYYARVPTNVNGAAADFGISVAKPFVYLSPGGSSVIELVTNAANGFTGGISFSASPALPGLTFAFAAGKVTVSASAAAAAGTSLVTISGSAGGKTRSTTLRISVLEAARTLGVPTNATATRGFTAMLSGLAVDASGGVHLVYEDDTALVSGDQIFYATSVDGGRSFSSPLLVSTNTDVAFNGRVALGPSGAVDLLYEALTASSDLRLFFLKSTDGGRTFSAPVSVSPASHIPDLPSIAADKNGNILVAYLEFTNSDAPDLYVVRSSDGGATFGTPVKINTTETFSILPLALAFDSKGAAYLGFSDVSTSPFSAKMAVAADGKTFATPIVVSDPATDSFAPSFAFDKSDALYVAYYERFGSTTASFNREAYFSKSTDGGKTFATRVNLSNNRGQSRFPVVLVDAKGAVTVAWEDDTDARTSEISVSEILLARSTDGGATFGPVVTNPANDTTYVDGGLSASTAYTFRVRAV